MNNKFYPKGLACLFALCAIFVNPIYGQEDKALIQIGKKANVLDNFRPSTFFEIPELKAKDGQLKTDLFINEQVYDFVGNTVKLRTYTYESGSNMSTKIGPWGPTLRIGKNDRLSVTIHNNLPFDQHQNYLGSMPKSLTAAMNEGGKVSDSLKDSLIFYTGGLIKPENLVLATIDVVAKNKSWTLNGKVPCECPVGQEGTCTKIAITYPIKRMFNYGSNEFALRIYESTEHEGEEHNHNIPHDFNNTNLHTHGFHVSPTQDDVFRQVNPTHSSYYTYDLEDHTAGTMWYHPHVHGSTGIQVASGMSGVIIIEDDPDTLKKYPALAEASEKEHERVMLFNQITYDKEIGENPDFNTMERVRRDDHIGTTINGVAVPQMIMKPGEVQRWRLVHSGYRSALALEFPKEAEVWQIAVDGIMFDKPRLMETIHMAPGNRTDLLVKFSKKMKGKSFSVRSINYNAKCEYFETDPDCLRNEELDGDHEEIINIRILGKAQSMKIPTSLPGPGNRHENIPESELSGIVRHTVFNIDLTKPETEFTINGEPYNGDTIPEILTLGTADEWVISSDFVSHPYHIHINPFLVYSFAGEKLKTPMWKDVVMVSDTETAVARARYTKYWGDFVIHCHILAHEDEGMMQRVRIVRPKLLKMRKLKSYDPNEK